MQCAAAGWDVRITGRACCVQDMSKEMAPLARGELYLGSCGGWLILVPGIPWLNLRLGGWRLPSKELEARHILHCKPHSERLLAGTLLLLKRSVRQWHAQGRQALSRRQ